jgi:membrane-bound lytic murein transglycosylase B
VKRLALLVCLLWPAMVMAAGNYLSRPEAQILLKRLKQEEGFAEKDLIGVRAALDDAEQIPSLIEAEQKSAEKTENWTTYSSKRVDPLRIRRGARFLHEQRDWLLLAESQYGVPPAVIAGVLGLETNFGRVTGSARVLDSLTTQGFDHPTRAPFFFSELLAYFAFCRDFGFDPKAMKGSYAGAMGWAQFMPSNYRRLAVDYDADGRRDLWQPADAIGSVARYLVDYDRARSWRRGEPLIVEARIKGKLRADVPRNTRMPTHTVAALRKLGVQAAVELPSATRVGLIELDVDQGKEYWLAMHNFYSVMSYNPRVYYAMTVSRLAEEMGRAAAESGDLSE